MQRVLGIDPGDVRVGLAISDELGMLAHPLETVEVRKKDLVPHIVEIVRQKEVGKIIVGVPRNMDGTFGPAAEKSRAFIALLKEAVACPVVPWDERLSTVSAQRNLRESGRKAKEQKGIIDQAAAQVILQSWLDAQPCA